MKDPTANLALVSLQHSLHPQMPPLRKLKTDDGSALPVLRSREEITLITTRDGKVIRRTRTYHLVR